MEKVGMDYSWGKVSCHDGHGQSSWTMPCSEKYPRTSQKKVQKIKTFKLSLVSVRSIGTSRWTKEQVQEICNGEKRRHFASK